MIGYMENGGGIIEIQAPKNSEKYESWREEIERWMEEREIKRNG